MSKRGIAVAMIALNVDFYYKGTTKKVEAAHASST